MWGGEGRMHYKNFSLCPKSYLQNPINPTAMFGLLFSSWVKCAFLNETHPLRLNLNYSSKHSLLRLPLPTLIHYWVPIYPIIILSCNSHMSTALHCYVTYSLCVRPFHTYGIVFYTQNSVHFNYTLVWRLQGGWRWKRD